MNCENSFTIENEIFYYWDLNKIFEIYPSLKKLPISLKILLEENLRNLKKSEDFEEIIDIFTKRREDYINFRPSRVIVDEYSSLLPLIDFALLKEKVPLEDRQYIEPKIMVDVIMDSSLSNFDEDDEDNSENFKDTHDEVLRFVKWADYNLKNLRVVPPGSGIFNQINLEYLSTIINVKTIENKHYLYPETVIGTDYNTNIINALGVFGFKVYKMDAQASMLGIPLRFKLPKVFGIKLEGKLNVGSTSYDLIKKIKALLSNEEFKDKIVEFCGEGIDELTLEDRAYVSNLAKKYNIKSLFFAIDEKGLKYYDNSRNNSDFSYLIKTYLQKQSFLNNYNIELDFDKKFVIKLDDLKPVVGDRKKIGKEFIIEEFKNLRAQRSGAFLKDLDVLKSIVYASKNINPLLLIRCALVLKNCYEKNISINTICKKIFLIEDERTKLFLEKLELLKYFELYNYQIKYSINEKDFLLEDDISNEIRFNSLNVVSLSSKRLEIEEDKYSLIKHKFTLSPSLVVIYTLVGNIGIDILNESLFNKEGESIYIKDVWPTNGMLISYLNKLDAGLYKEIYENLFKGNEKWQNLKHQKGSKYFWNSGSTYLNPIKLDFDFCKNFIHIDNAKILSIYGDNVSTSDIVPMGDRITLYSNAAKYLEKRGIKSYDYGTYFDRRGNYEIILGTVFSNLKNKMVSKEGAYTEDFETREILSIYDYSKRLKEANISSIIISGKEFGIEEDFSWAARGIYLLGVKAVIAKSFDEKFRLNLVRFGVLPLEFIEDEDVYKLNIIGNETITISLETQIKPKIYVDFIIESQRITQKSKLKCRLDNYDEVEFYQNGGILQTFLKESFIQHHK